MKKTTNSQATRNSERRSVTRSTPVVAAPHGRVVHRRDLHVWRASLPTRLERDTLLTPLWVAESIVQEVERYLKADLPANWARRLAAKAHYLYPRHKHFKAGLNRPAGGGWRTCGCSCGIGRRAGSSAPSRRSTKNYLTPLAWGGRCH